MTTENLDFDIQPSSSAAESHANSGQLVSDAIVGDRPAADGRSHEFDEARAQQDGGRGPVGPGQSALPGLEGH